MESNGDGYHELERVGSCYYNGHVLPHSFIFNLQDLRSSLTLA